jgi:hypothetical protein
MPSPCRWKALRNDGQVVPNSAAAALTLPSRSARAKARSASARSARKRLGCQPSGWRSCPPTCSAALGYDRVLSDAEVALLAAAAWSRLRRPPERAEPASTRRAAGGRPALSRGR